MSEQPNYVFDDWVDWSKIDLLDACYDPGLGLNGSLQYPQLSGYSHSPALMASTQPSSTELWARDGLLMTSEEQDVMRAEPERESNNICVICKQSFSSKWDLQLHGLNVGHPTWPCRTLGCNQLFPMSFDRDDHEGLLHKPEHGRAATVRRFECIECNASLWSQAKLLRHAKKAQHQPYACECGTRFSRLDVLHRHVDSFDTSVPRFPCKYCNRHRGQDGFRRKDHLVQHVRNYHHLESDLEASESASGKSGSSSRLSSFPACSYEGCPQFRTDAFKELPRNVQEDERPFGTQAEYTRHMRDEHYETAFPCDVPGCDRTGRRGYAREKALINHRKKDHPEAHDYTVSARELKHKCTEPGCNALLDPSSLSQHYVTHDRKLSQVSLQSAAPGRQVLSPPPSCELTQDNIACSPSPGSDNDVSQHVTAPDWYFGSRVLDGVPSTEHD